MNNDDNKELDELLDNESEGEVPSSDYSDYEDEIPEEEYDQGSYQPQRSFVTDAKNGFKSGIKGQPSKRQTEEQKSKPQPDQKSGINGQSNNIQNNKISDKNRHADEATKNKLKDRKNKTAGKFNNQNANVQTPSIKQKPSKKEETGKAAKEKAGQKAKQATKEAAKKAGQKAKQAAVSLFQKLAANPYFWLVIVVLILAILFIILVVVLYAAYYSSEEENDGGGNNDNNGTISYVAGYDECTSITVDGLGTYNLEDYVAGVIQHEAYQDDGNEEALKAQAVAARTYAINYTGNCTGSISNSQGAQTFSTTPSEKAKAAANATAGQVLTYNGSVFSAQYDSFCYADKDCPDATKDTTSGTYSVTYTKVPNGETHTVKLTDSTQYSRIVPGGGHARGMSQLVSYEMSKNGSSYQDILKYFYSDGVEISSITETAGATDATEATNIPTSVDDLKTRYWFTFDIDTYASIDGSGSHLFGQCVWYAKHRAMDIVNSSNLSQSEKDTRINELKTVMGNGQDIVPNLDGNIFKKTYDIDSIQAPAIISWTHSTYGHVGIIEQISTDNSGNKTYYITDGGRKKNSAGNWYTVSKDNLWTVVNFWSTPNADKATVQSRWSGYTFNGAASLTG